MADLSRQPDLERRINDHLEAIDKAMAAKGIPLVERRSVTDDVETQIRDMLAADGKTAHTMEDLEAVLLGLDAPESYAEAPGQDLADSPREPEPPPPATPPRYSRTAILGAVWAPLMIVAMLFFIVPMRVAPSEANRGPSAVQWAAMIILFPLAVAAPFGTTILGWMAVSRIRNSRGRLCGLGLALADGLFFPLLALDVLLYLLWRVIIAVAISWKVLGAEALGRPSYAQADQNVMLIFILTAFTALIVDWLIIRWAWRKVSAPPGKV